ncbi:unnamed protein product [Prunus armeniaca]
MPEPCGARIAARVDLVFPRPTRIAARVDLVSPRPTRITARVNFVFPRPTRPTRCRTRAQIPKWNLGLVLSFNGGVSFP